MTNKDHNAYSQFTGNPRFLDRLNAVITVVMLIVLAAFVLLALQSRAQAAGVQATVDLVERASNSIAPTAVAAAIVEELDA